MSKSKYLRVLINGQQVDLDAAEKFPISINYKLEDPENFQRKKSSESFNNTFPATTKNDQIANTFHNPGVEDFTDGEELRGHQPAVVEANGHELLIGKAFLTSAKHLALPTSYQYDFYGNNADWIIDLKEATLFDFLKHLNFPFTKQLIIDSWAYNGRSESLPYVFAPVRYGNAMADYVDTSVTPSRTITDFNMKPEYMKPAISPYWIIYWAFKSLGYRIESEFLNTDYFRKQVMPWTWGNFLFSEGTRLNNLDFLAKSRESSYFSGDYTGIWDLKVTNDNSNGAFDNNGVYSYNTASNELVWTYLQAFDYGILDAVFHLSVLVDATVAFDSDAELRAQWFKNGVRITTGNAGENGNGDLICAITQSGVGRNDFAGIVDLYQTFNVKAGDKISVKFYMHTFATSLGRANIRAEVMAFELDYFRIPLGGTIDFQNYSGLKKAKFLDFFAGIIDYFNLSVQTDPVLKTVIIEPTHAYSLTNDMSNQQGGYFNSDFLDYSDKQDLSKESDMRQFSEYEREVIFTTKEDGNDGLLKVVQDRTLTSLATGKYVLPNRFKSGKKEVKNRFFSAVVHYDAEQWRGLGSDPAMSPQMICMVPENISNTSRDEAQNTFAPKLAYYKGMVTNVGWVFDGVKMNNYPFMFAVNYQAGGENDPILSYSDERIGKYPNAVLGKGLLRRFYLQRMAILRNGQFYKTNFNLNNLDIGNWFHREHIICRGQRWQLMEIKGYRPLLNESTECELQKWVPVSLKDSENTFPSIETVLETGIGSSSYDIKYSPLKCLPSDIPQSSTE